MIAGANIRSQTFTVARTSAPCRRCGRPTLLLALGLPGSHETLETDEWQRAGAEAFLFHVQDLSPGVQHRLQQLSPHFRAARSAATQNTCWVNHCAHCGVLFDDDELHCEPGGAFFPMSETAAAAIELIRIDLPIEAASSGYALAPEFLPFMRRS